MASHLEFPNSSRKIMARGHFLCVITNSSTDVGVAAKAPHIPGHFKSDKAFLLELIPSLRILELVPSN